MAKVTLEITDQVNCRFVGLDPKTRRKVMEKMEFFLPYARYTTPYKLGRWDGMVKFFDVGGRTYINLLPQVLPIIVEAGYEVSVCDQRENWSHIQLPNITPEYFADQGKVWPKGHPVEGQPVILRDYQVEAANRYFANPHSLQEISTGAGKTLLTAALAAIAEQYGRTITIVPSTSLVEQTLEDFENLGLDVGAYYGNKKDTDKTHIICTWQSLNVLEKKGKGQEAKPLEDFLEGVVAVICDEVHGAKADALKKMLSGTMGNIPLRWGMTGTIPKEDWNVYSILSVLGPVVGTIKASTLQANDVLAKCDIVVAQLMDDKEYPDYQKEVKFLTSDERRLTWMAELSMGITNADGNTLVLVNKIESGKVLQDIFETKFKKKVRFIYGNTKSTDRKEGYDSVKYSDDEIVIATYGVAAVGINMPRLFNVVMLEPGKSFVRTIQTIGRGLRKAHDKDDVVIYDVTSNCKYSKRHLTERKKFYKDAEYPFKVKKIDYLNGGKLV